MHTFLMNEILPGQEATIVEVLFSPEFAGLQSRLYEFGFTEGAHIRLMHEAPFGGDPIAVEVRGTLVALRREDAKLIRVKLNGEPK